MMVLGVIQPQQRTTAMNASFTSPQHRWTDLRVTNMIQRANIDCHLELSAGDIIEVNALAEQLIPQVSLEKRISRQEAIVHAVHRALNIKRPVSMAFADIKFEAAA